MADDSGNRPSFRGGITPSSPSYDIGSHAAIQKRTPATDRRTTNGQLRAAFNGNTRLPGLSITGRKPVRPALPLSTADKWSPTHDQPVRSAGVPPKSSWDSFPGRNGAVHVTTSPAFCLSSATQLGTSPESPLSGRGMSGNAHSHVRSFKNSPTFSKVRFTQTEEYHNASPPLSPSTTSRKRFVPRSAPLPQQTFDEPQEKIPKTSAGGHNGSARASFAHTHYSSAPSSATQFTGEQHSYEQTSPSSSSVTISDHYLETNPEHAGAKGEVWSEQHHSQGLRRAFKDPSTEWEEAFDGALKILSSLNPETYQMPFGTRVINIKTEYPRNVLLSIQYNKYSVMEKVAQRVMAVWDARQHPSEKVLFLFSVNGSKKFCGVAEMCGPWKQNEQIPEWEHNPDSSPCVGTIPLVWVYAKDVNYHQFIHIRQPHNQNTVGNMWNGMNFPSAIGREVMEAYVKTPATSSILGHPKNCAENEGLPPASMNYRRGCFNARAVRGGRGDSRGGARVGHSNARHWRQQTEPKAADSRSDVDQTPTAAAPVLSPTNTFSRTEPAPKIKSMTCKELALVSTKRSQQTPMKLDENIKPDPLGYVPQLKSGPSTSTLQARSNPTTSFHSFYELPSEPSPSYYDPLRSPEARSGAFQPSLRTVEDTPTHRPGHVTRSTASPPGKDLIFGLQSLNMLKAKYHSTTAEEYVIKEELEQQIAMSMSTRILDAKMSRVLAEKREVQARLAMMGVCYYPEVTSPTRHDSFSSTEPDSANSTDDLQTSPGLAEDRRRLLSISKLDSPQPQETSTSFDKAPGGSGRLKRPDQIDDYDAYIKKSVAELLGSPEQKQSVPARPALQASTFLPNEANNPGRPQKLRLNGSVGQVGLASLKSPSAIGNGNGPDAIPSNHGSDQASSIGDREDCFVRPGTRGGVRL